MEQMLALLLLRWFAALLIVGHCVQLLPITRVYSGYIPWSFVVSQHNGRQYAVYHVMLLLLVIVAALVL